MGTDSKTYCKTANQPLPDKGAICGVDKSRSLCSCWAVTKSRGVKINSITYLKALAQIVAVLERSTGIENDIHLHVELVAGVVSLQPLYLLDRFREAHRQVQNCTGSEPAVSKP